MSMGNQGGPPRAGGLLGSLREALANASKDDTGRAEAKAVQAVGGAVPPPLPATPSQEHTSMMRNQSPSAAEAAREARGGTPNIPPIDSKVEIEAPPTTRVLRSAKSAGDGEAAPARTQLVRGKGRIARQSFACASFIRARVPTGRSLRRSCRSSPAAQASRR